MKTAALITLTTATAANAFVHHAPFVRSVARMAESAEATEEAVVEEEVVAAPAYPTINGWTADEKAFCWGLPGSTSPLGEFDPLGLCKDLDLTETKRFREAEVTHGRVAMTAVLGFLVAESFHPLFGGDITGPAIYHLTEVRKVAPLFFELLAGTIATAELYRSLVGWVPPNEVKKYFGGELKESYYPGDIGFDPLGLKPSSPEEFVEMQNRELNNGRLAMLAAMGFIVQERINETPILANLGM